MGAVTLAAGIMSARSKPSSDPSAMDMARGLRLNTRSTQEPIKVVYGTMQVGGNDVFIEATGDDNKDLWVVQTLAEGECEGIVQDNGVDQIFLDSKLYTEYGGNVSHWFYGGTDSQTINQDLNNAVANWTDPLRHTCYVVFKLTYNRDYFNSFPKRNVLLKGRKLFDFRTSTTSWSDNPVLALYDFMTNTRYGLGKDPSVIDTDSWGEAATHCENKGWKLNMAIGQSESAQDILDSILRLFRGQMVWYDGMFYLRYADLLSESTVMSITDAHIVQDGQGRAQISISQPSKFGKADGLRAKFIDPTKNYAVDDLLVGDEQGVITEMRFLGCTNREHVKNLANYNLERLKLDRTISGTFRDDCLQLEPNDLVNLTVSSLAIADQPARVQQADIQSNGLINLSLLYEDELLYNDTLDEVEEGVYTCNLPDKDQEPPSVSISPSTDLTEEVYDQRLRSLTTLKVHFTKPPNYPWFSHVKVFISYDAFDLSNGSFDSDNYWVKGTGWSIASGVAHCDGSQSAASDLYQDVTFYPGQEYQITYTVSNCSAGIVTLYVGNEGAGTPRTADGTYTEKIICAGDPTNRLYLRADTDFIGDIDDVKIVETWHHLFNAENDFKVEPLREGQTIWLRLKTVSIWGQETSDTSDAMVSKYLVGATETVPPSLGTLEAIVSENNIKLYSGWLENPDIELYEFRLGTSWTGAIFLAALRSPNLNLDGVKPGSHDFWCNTFSTNGRYGDYPRSASAEMVDPPDGWSVISPEETCNYQETGETHNNTEHIEYNGADYLKCSHTGGNLTGTYTSPVYDRGASGRYMVYALADIDVVGAGTAWDDVIPTTDYDIADMSRANPCVVSWTGHGLTTGDTVYLKDITQAEWVNLNETRYTVTVINADSFSLDGVDTSYFGADYVPGTDDGKIHKGQGTIWADLDIANKSWLEIFDLPAAPAVRMRLKYGMSDPPDKVVERQEILAAIVTGQYFQFEIEITDPNPEVYAYVEHFTLKFCQKV